MNETNPTSCFNPTGNKIGKTIAYCVLIVVSLTGNTLIGIIVYKTKTMRKTINFFIVNMAASDLLFSMFVVPLAIAGLYVDPWSNISSSFGNALCKLDHLLPPISFTVSILSLILIAVDRFVAVVFPLRSPLISSKLCPFLILATWIIPTVVHAPYFIVYKLVENPNGMMCALQWNEVFGNSLSHENFTLALFVVFLLIPLAAIATLYIIINVKLRSQKAPGEQSDNSRQQRVKRERNVLRMAIAIVSWFAVCWLPFAVMELMQSFVWDRKTMSCSLKTLSDVVRFMPFVNTAMNPCVCFIFSGNYRQGIKDLLRCRSERPRGVQVTPLKRNGNNNQPDQYLATSVEPVQLMKFSDGKKNKE